MPRPEGAIDKLLHRLSRNEPLPAERIASLRGQRDPEARRPHMTNAMLNHQRRPISPAAAAWP